MRIGSFEASVKKLSAIAILLSIALAGGARHPSFATVPNQSADITGTWALNRAASDDPAKVMEAIHREHDEGARERGSMHGMFGGGGPSMHGGEPPEPERMRARLEGPERLSIAQAEGTITFSDEQGRSQTLQTTNKKQRIPHGDQSVDVRTKWKDGKLIKKTSLDSRMTLTETYSVASDPRQLFVLVKLEGSQLPRPIELRRVYDRGDPR